MIILQHKGVLSPRRVEQTEVVLQNRISTQNFSKKFNFLD
jgi:hypothetical protein